MVEVQDKIIRKTEEGLKEGTGKGKWRLKPNINITSVRMVFLRNQLQVYRSGEMRNFHWYYRYLGVEITCSGSRDSRIQKVITKKNS